MTDVVPGTGTTRDGGTGAIIQAGSTMPVGASFVQGVTAYGSAFVTLEGQRPTFSGGAIGISLAATPSDIIQVSSVSKTIRLLRLSISGTIATTAQVITFQLFRRTSAASGNTPQSVTVQPHDSTNVSATGTLQYWNAAGGNPSSASSGGGLVRSGTVAFNIVGTDATAGYPLVWDFVARTGQALVLRTGQQAVVNANGVTLNGTTSLNFDVEWAEE